MWGKGGSCTFAAIRRMGGEGLLQIEGGGALVEHTSLNHRLVDTMISYARSHDRSCGKCENCSNTEESNLTILRRKSNSLSCDGGGGGGRRRN